MFTERQKTALATAKQQSILEVAQSKGATFKKVGNGAGGVYRGACPNCGGTDRFTIKLDPPLWHCNQCHSEKWGDIISLHTFLFGGDFIDALCVWGGYDPDSDTERKGGKRNAARMVTTPVKVSTPKPVLNIPVERGEAWQTAGREHVAECEYTLWDNMGAAALDYLRGRGLSDETIATARLGFNPKQFLEPSEKWGGKEGDKGVQLWRGITIPYFTEGKLWNIRTRLSPSINGTKYLPVVGVSGAYPLYNADMIQPGQIAVISEGEIDALSIQQATGGGVASLATGGTTAARSMKWVAYLSLCDLVLITFDNDSNEAGNKGAAWWLDRLPNAFRWLPYDGYKDANDMLKQGGNDAVYDWIEAGIDEALKAGHRLLTGAVIRNALQYSQKAA